jgi:hypothetical protein
MKDEDRTVFCTKLIHYIGAGISRTDSSELNGSICLIVTSALFTRRRNGERT